MVCGQDVVRGLIRGRDEDNLRILVVIPDGIRHPLLVGFLRRETWASGDAQYDGEKNQAMQCSGYNEGKPHAEVIDL